MNSLFSFAVGVLFVSGAVSAAEFTAEEKACGPGVYCAEEMVCIGRIANPPKGMHSDYFVNVTYIKAFKTTKNLGGSKRALVDALVVNEVPVGDTPNITLAEAWAKGEWDYGWYGAPARVKNNTVKIPWGGGYGDAYTFTIDKSVAQDGYRLDKLTGKAGTAGSVVGDYETNYECEAKVVKTPSRIDDFTKAH